MKSVIIALATTFVFAACNSKSSEPEKNVVGIDTTGLYKNNMIADTSMLSIAPGTTTKKVVETHSPDGSVTTTTTTTSADKPVAKAITKASTTSSAGTSSAGTSTVSTQPATVQKTGWSSRAKGAVIGGVGGAVVGAAVSKKKANGAIIGGAVGAAGGYIIGNEKDKKTGR